MQKPLPVFTMLPLKSVPWPSESNVSNIIILADCKNIVTRLQMEAAHFKTELGHDVPIDYLASRLADYNQTTTQKAMQRVFGV